MHLISIWEILKISQGHQGVRFHIKPKKCHFAQSQVKYLGHIIGSGIRKPDEKKVATVKDMQVPETKTNLTENKSQIEYQSGEKENLAFEKLKEELCKATTQSMSIADFSKLYLIEVDSSANTVGAALLQSVEGQGNRPIAFAS